jgi:hypothetical protein
MASEVNRGTPDGFADATRRSVSATDGQNRAPIAVDRSSSDLDRAPGNPQAENPMASWPTGRLLSTASRLVEHAWAEALESHGLTHAGLIVLHFLSGVSLTAPRRSATRTTSRPASSRRSRNRMRCAPLCSNLSPPAKPGDGVSSTADHGGVQTAPSGF